MKEICVAAPSVALIKDLQTKMHTTGMKYQVLKGTTRQGIADGISLCTFHSMKGLEFRVIILLGVNERNLPSKVNSSSYCMAKMDALAQKEYLSSIRSLLYVAITRARQLVFMVGYGEPCGLLDNMK
jgi:superfamily I DNA/RNA helicase